MSNEIFCRTEQLLGADGMNKLANARVAVFGLGGVGSYIAEALARSGVGALDLIDKDAVEPSNINRQLYATHDTVGRLKVDVAKERIAAINPACKVTAHPVFFLPDTADTFDFAAYDYVADAIDTVTGKIELIVRAKACNTPVISAMGAGNKLDATAFRVADIHKTDGCPLARVMRRLCRERGIDALKVVYSPEPPLPKVGDTTGSTAFVPPVAGLIMAGEIVKDLAR